MIKMINESSDNDDYLGRLHALLLMDDTILLATTRERLEKKFKIVQEFCKEYGMKINLKKSKFMVINCDLHKSDIMSEALTVQHVCSYIYLGSPITEDGDYASCLRIHTKENVKHVLNVFNSFINTSTNMPYKIKKQVAEACILSTILYACET